MSDHNFNTPPDFLARVRSLDARGIGLDPCSNPYSMVDARVEWHEGDNGLDPKRSWRGKGLVFMNPPHSLSPYNIEPWIERAYNEFWEWTMTTDPHPSEDQFVALVPAKTGPAWFHDFGTEFTQRVFLRGRIRFWSDGHETPGPGRFDSLVLYAGNYPERFIEAFGDMGWVA